jgi:hypothetical protein
MARPTLVLYRVPRVMPHAIASPRPITNGCFVLFIQFVMPESCRRPPTFGPPAG